MLLLMASVIAGLEMAGTTKDGWSANAVVVGRNRVEFTDESGQKVERDLDDQGPTVANVGDRIEIRFDGAYVVASDSTFLTAATPNREISWSFAGFAFVMAVLHSSWRRRRSIIARSWGVAAEHVSDEVIVPLRSWSWLSRKPFVGVSPAGLRLGIPGLFQCGHTMLLPAAGLAVVLSDELTSDDEPAELPFDSIVSRGQVALIGLPDIINLPTRSMYEMGNVLLIAAEPMAFPPLRFTAGQFGLSWRRARRGNESAQGFAIGVADTAQFRAALELKQIEVTTPQMLDDRYPVVLLDAPKRTLWEQLRRVSGVVGWSVAAVAVVYLVTTDEEIRDGFLWEHALPFVAVLVLFSLLGSSRVLDRLQRGFRSKK